MTGDDVASGEQLVDYLQPFPVRGTGFHRHVFVLFQHPHKLDFSPFKRSTPWYAAIQLCSKKRQHFQGVGQVRRCLSHRFSTEEAPPQAMAGISKWHLLFSTSLSERTFSTMELHGAFDGELVPVGLRFFQSDWDRSVSDVYHHTLSEYQHKTRAISLAQK